MRWSLPKDTFWRRSGGEVLLANPSSVLRLNAASSSLFEIALGTRSHGDAFCPEALSQLVAELCAEGMLERSVEPSDPATQQLEALPSRTMKDANDQHASSP